MIQAMPVDQEHLSRQRTVLLAVDLKNSVLAEIDAGNPNRIAYSPYGQQSSQHGVMTRLGFNGELRELEPEWYLLGNGYRAYNPRLMRFHSPDSWSPFDRGGLNAYMYCSGEPVMNSDPTGQSIWAVSKAWDLLTKRMTNVTTQVASTAANVAKNAVQSTAGLIGSSVSRVSDSLGRARKSLIAATIGSEPFPVPPTSIAKLQAINHRPPPSRGFTNRANHVSQQIKSAQQANPGVSPVRQRNLVRKDQYRPAPYDHTQASIDARQSTQLKNRKTGEIVANIRTN